MTTDRPTLGTLLRHLIDLLDGAVEQQYVVSGLTYRPRYTPVVRTLEKLGPASIRAIAQHAGLTHSAVSQTVAQMARQGLVRKRPGSDAREQIIALSPAARAMLPALQRHWTKTNAAAHALDDELTMPLSDLLTEAIAALDRSSFTKRIEKQPARPRTRKRK
jgi:DNA-binding MarR family transcriptional regulator